MINKQTWNGVYPPVPTILDEQGRLDKDGMGALIDKLINEGVNGMLFLGSGGEFCHMSKQMRFEVAEFVVSYTKRRVPVLLGVSSSSTAEAIEFGLHADQLGVDAVLLLNPYYALLNDEYIFNHFRSVADSIQTPIILYNFPALTGQDICPTLVLRLANEVPQIIGIKDTVDNMSHLREIINTVRPIHPEFIIFSGFDEYMLGALILGANGAIPATANFASFITCGIYQSFIKKDYEKAFSLQCQLSKLSSIYLIEQPFFAVIKESIKLTGLDISTQVLSPVQKLSDKKSNILKEILTKSNIKTV